MRCTIGAAYTAWAQVPEFGSGDFSDDGNMSSCKDFSGNYTVNGSTSFSSGTIGVLTACKGNIRIDSLSGTATARFNARQVNVEDCSDSGKVLLGENVATAYVDSMTGKCMRIQFPQVRYIVIRVRPTYNGLRRKKSQVVRAVPTAEI